MSVIVVGMEMPDICQNCACFSHMVIDDTYFFQLCNARHKTIREPTRTKDITPEWYNTERPKWCPLFELKDWRKL